MLVCLNLAACGVRGFKRDGATHEDFAQDMRECLYESRHPEVPCYHDPFIGCKRDEVRNQCMVRKGWRITREDGSFMAPH